MQAFPGSPDSSAAADPRALVLRGLTKEYRKGSPVLHGIDLVLPGSGLTAIIGPSGTGKSTLIRCINRLVPPPFRTTTPIPGRKLPGCWPMRHCWAPSW